MTPTKNYFTSEAVSNGHPDKIADQISDCVLDTYLSHDPQAHVACETIVTKQTVLVSGEISSKKYIDEDEIACNIRQCLKNIGCTEENFCWKTVKIHNWLHKQSKELLPSVEAGKSGDQGIIVGYATNETPTFMPAALYYAQNLINSIQLDRSAGILPDIMPDGKSLITVQYSRDDNGNKQIHSIKNVVLSVQHKPHITKKDVTKILQQYIQKTLPKNFLTLNTQYFINHAGEFTQGGPATDTGVTGRKIVVDTYGGIVPNGGGAFSGKDPSKVDRSVAYMARYIAKNIVSAKLAHECTIYMSYAINKASPISVTLRIHPDCPLLTNKLLKYINQYIDLSPAAIIKKLQLLKPFYLHTSQGGHFGRDPMNNGCFSWEKTDIVPQLIEFCKSNT